MENLIPCTNCGHSNPANSQFCSECDTPLSNQDNFQAQQEISGNNNVIQNNNGNNNVVVGVLKGNIIVQTPVSEIKARKFIKKSPYKSLNKFERKDKDLFFGRDQFIIDLVNEIKETNFILLLGASGSGKSSVVRAGLIPELEKTLELSLLDLTFTPDIDPCESFYACLLRYYQQTEAKIAREVKADTLTQVVKSLKRQEDYWLIFIDQFEQLLTPSDEHKKREFINGLVKLSKANLQNVKIVVTMRADFLDKLSPYPQLLKATQKHRPMIAKMQPDELRLAIEQPAICHGVVFEDGLVDEIIKDVKERAGYLPLLQYTLDLLWEEEINNGSINNDRTLNTSTYRRLGRVRGALEKRVNSIYGGLSQQEQFATQKIFLKLVAIGGDLESETEWKPIRRREFRSEFEDELEQSVLDKLIDENLLVSDSVGEKSQSTESTIEITHEILLTSWTTLNDWITKNRYGISLRNRLNDDVARWKQRKPDDELWSGSKLEQVLELSKDKTFIEVLGGFSQDANQFIDASVNFRERQRRRTIYLLGGFSTVVTILAGFIGYQLWRTSIAETNERIRALTATSEALFNSGLKNAALAESMKAGQQLQQANWVNTDTRTQVVATLSQVLYGQDYKAPKTFKGHSNFIQSAIFSPDGKIIASASVDKTVKLWDVSTGNLIRTLKGHLLPVHSISFSPDGKTIASASLSFSTIEPI